MIKLKRAYETPSRDDGFRVLVERLWPRGLKKTDARLDVWLKDAAPTPELRKWYDHDVSKWDEFQKRYRAELKKNEGALEQIRQRDREGIVTFVYAARDGEHSSAAILKAFIETG